LGISTKNDGSAGQRLDLAKALAAEHHS
jgi:hypothetical protein